MIAGVDPMPLEAAVGDVLDLRMYAEMAAEPEPTVLLRGSMTVYSKPLGTGGWQLLGVVKHAAVTT